MSKIPTAEEFLRKNIDYVLEKDCKEDVENAMIEFAKLHVEAALKAASENANTKDVPFTDDVEVDEDSILNSYSTDNIK